MIVRCIETGLYVGPFVGSAQFNTMSPDIALKFKDSPEVRKQFIRHFSGRCTIEFIAWEAKP